MSAAPRPRRRRAYTLVIVLVTCFLVLGFVAVTEALVLVEWGRDRQTGLDAYANQLLASTQAWSGLHAAELGADQVVELPVQSLLPKPMDGAARLRCTRAATGTILVEGEVTVGRAGRHLTRRAVWPLPAVPP